MTPQEHDLVTQLFDRLAGLENTPRDPEAERAIIDGLRRAPNAVYALVQTVLVQDEALKQANARIRELTAGSANAEPSRPTGFLDSMRDALLGRPPVGGRGSVPSVQPGQSAAAAAAPTHSGFGGPVMSQPPMPMAPGGSFLGTAAAAAAGVIGGSLLLDGIRSAMGHGHGAFGFADPAYAASPDAHSPWASGSSDLAHQAGIDDVGTSGQSGDASNLDDNGSGLADDGSGTGGDDGYDAGADDQFGSDFEGGADFGGGDAGGSDFA